MAKRVSVRDLVTIDGVTKSVREWAQEKKLSFNTIRMRVGRGWSYERALTTPVEDLCLKKLRRKEEEKRRLEETRKRRLEETNNGIEKKPEAYDWRFEHFTSRSGAYVKKKSSE